MTENNIRDRSGKYTLYYISLLNVLQFLRDSMSSKIFAFFFLQVHQPSHPLHEFSPLRDPGPVGQGASGCRETSRGDPAPPSCSQAAVSMTPIVLLQRNKSFYWQSTAISGHVSLTLHHKFVFVPWIQFCCSWDRGKLPPWHGFRIRFIVRGMQNYYQAFKEDLVW